MFLESFILYSLKSYRFITKLFSLIVKNAFSVLDFILLFCWCCFLFLLFLTFLVGVVMGFVFEWFLCFGFLEPI